MRLLAVLAVTLLIVGAGACGGASKAATRAGMAGNGDPDDGRIRSYGHMASPADGQAVAGLVKRYYAAAVAGDAAAVCPLIHVNSSEAVSFPEGFAVELMSSLLHGRNCVRFVASLLEEAHRRLVAEHASLAVTGVRVSGPTGFALLAFDTLPERVLPVERTRGTWKLATLLPSPVP
jgi:hypothetical protein